ncbi:MAG: Gfo/Idh/MocA family protein [Candidatus Xenobiia bacterium LiM19]
MYNTLIIGCGNVGTFFDVPSSSDILTHAHAYYNHNDFNIVGFVDTVFERAQKASQIWGGKAYSSVSHAFKDQDIQVISVSSPDSTHYNILKELLKYNFKLVLAEKPLTESLDHAREIQELYAYKSIPVAVNYSRRFVPEFDELRKRILSDRFGNYVAGTAYYGKGLLHNGSHLIDILSFLTLKVTKMFRYLSHLEDYAENDKSVSAILEIVDKAFFLMQAIDCRLFSIFEFDLVFEKARIRIVDSGLAIEYYEIQRDSTFDKYKKLLLSEKKHTSLRNSLKYAVANISDYLKFGSPLKSTIDNAVDVIRVCEEIKTFVR